MESEQDLLRRLYDAFNARDMDSALEGMDEHVVWANGMEGGYVHGRAGVREYWTRQWTAIDPRVQPTSFDIGADGETIVTVHQLVRDMQGTILMDKSVKHIFRIENGVVIRFDIQEQ